MKAMEAVKELLDMVNAESQKNIPYEDKSAFLNETKERVIEIGKALDATGGFDLMRSVHDSISHILSFTNDQAYLRHLEMAWADIGMWRG